MPEMVEDWIRQTDDNVSHKLGVRRQIARLLRDLLQADDPLVVAARQTALLATGRDLLVMLGRYLDTSDPQAISRLGNLAAAYPDRGAMVALLRRQALDPQHSDLKRMATMVILEQFLAQELEDHFFSTLRDPTQVAMNSLVQVLESAHLDRNLLLAYLSALEEQHPAALVAVLESLGKLSGAQGVEILKLFAQHHDEQLADRACQMLGRQRTLPALRALQMLALVVPPPRRDKVQRVLRKLAMAGVDLPGSPPRPAGARALLTGVDGAGASALWFVVPRADGQVQLLSLLLSDTRGLTDAFGGDNFSAESFPPAAPLGTVHTALDSRAAPGDLRAGGRAPLGTDLSLPADRGAGDAVGDEPLLDDAAELALYQAAADTEADFLEVDFDYGRHLVRVYQEINWAAGLPLPWEYRLLHDIIWRFDPLLPVPAAVPRPARAGQDTTRLLALPYFQSWRLHDAAIYHLAEEMLVRNGGVPLDLPLPAPLLPGLPAPGARAHPLRTPAAVLAGALFLPEQRALYAGRLRRSAEWLHQAGDAPAAGLALLAEAEMDATPGGDPPPFLRALVERSVLHAAHSLLLQGDPPVFSPFL